MFTFLKKYTRWISLAMAVLLLTASVLQGGLVYAAASDTVAGWTFSGTGTASSFTATSGSATNVSNAKLTISGGRSGTYSGSTIYTAGWNVADGYWQAQLNTQGYTGLNVAFKSYGTGTGPKDFKLQYSLDGTSFEDVPNATFVQETSSASNTFTLPSSVDNKANVYIRWLNYTTTSINDGTIGNTGTSRMADIVFTGVPSDNQGGGGTPDPSKTASPDVGKITFQEDYTTVRGVTGAVYGSATVKAYLPDQTPAGTTTAQPDGSFQLGITNPGLSTAVKLTAAVSGKDESDAVSVSIAKSTKPDASKMTFTSATTITGAVGSVANQAKVSAYFDDNSLAGTSTAGADGSFTITFTNPSNKTSVGVTSKETGKLESDKTTLNLSAPSGNYKPGDIVFSQIYVNGGNSGAFYNTKFFELYNTTNQDIQFNNQWALIYTAASGASFGTGTKLTGTIKAHGYYLVAGASGATGSSLPVTPDQTMTLKPSGSTGGILALANSVTGLTSQDDAKAIDIIAFGNGTNTNFTTKTDHWGLPFFSSSIGGGTLLRKTDAGSDPKGVIGLGNGFFSKDPSNDFILNVPSNPNNPEDIAVRSSKSMIQPDAAKISFANASGSASVTGAAGSVPASSTVQAYTETGGVVTSAGQATAAADGSFALSFSDSGNHTSVYVTHTDKAHPVSKESAYTRVDTAANPSAVVPIGQLRNNDANGMLLNIGYTTTIEGTVTAANKANGTMKASFYIQDATGGIQIIDKQAPSAAITVGNKVKISGKLLFTAGMTQFVPTAITDEGANGTPTAPVIALDALSSYGTAEPLEGTLVSIKGKVTNIPSTGPDYNVTIADDAGNTAIVKISGASGIDVNSVSLGDTYAFTGIVGQSKAGSPYTSGYYIEPRNDADIKGELQFQHEPMTKGYSGIDIPVKAAAKYADSVTLFYKNDGETSFASLPMVTTDKLNYNAKIPKQYVTATKMYYYIEAASAGQATQNSGSAVAPHSMDIVADTDGPSYSNQLPLPMDSIETFHPVVSVDLEDPNGVDANSLTLDIDGKDFTQAATKTETQMKLVMTSADDLAVGNHTVNVSAKDKLGNLSTASWTFQIVPRFTGGNHYRGTTHNHTQISHDAKGTPEAALQAAQAYGYDYFAFSDHSHDIDSSKVGTDTVDHNGMPERTGGSDWQLTKDLAKQYTKDGNFVVFPAFEMTSTTWGHSNVFGTSNFIDRVQSGGKYQNLQNYYAWTLTYDNIVAQFNHPAMSANAFDNFIPYDKNVDRLFTMLEVGNGSGNYSYVNTESKFFSALDLGWHVAPTYGEDNHDASWGQTKKRTVIVSKDLTQDSLLDAMRKMHVYFSEDPNFQLDMLANGYYMGATVDSKVLSFDVKGSDPVLETKSDLKYNYLTTASNDNIAKVELITNGGRVIDSYTPTTDNTSFSWKPSVSVLGGQQWFVVRVTQKDGDRIYSAPIWSQADPLAVKVSDLSIVEGAAVAGIPVTLKAGISNLGTINLTNLTAHFYYDSIDSTHFIGDSTIATLGSNKNADATVSWQNPVAGEHKLIVVLEAGDGNNLGDNKYEQPITVKAPLGITVMIDATHKNENTTSDTGTYANNLTDFTLNLRKQGYTVVENKAAITDQLLSNVGVLMVTHPSSAYSDNEIAALKRFVDRGGSLLLTEKSNFGGTPQNLNSLLSGIGSSILVNNDGVFDETAEGNFWSAPLNSNFSVRLHLRPVSNGLTDFISLLDYYSGPSLAANDGAGNKVPLTDSSTVTILARGNESTFQDSPQVKADTVSYNVYTANGKNGPALTNVTGGSAIPLVASEQLGSGRILVAGMNIFNDKQMTQNDGPTNNMPLSINAVNWLAHIEPKVIPMSDARKLPEGANVVVQGKVTTTAFYDSAYIQDDTGGIVAFGEVPAGSLQLGDTVRVYGHIGVFENDKEVIFDKFTNSVVKLSSGPAVQPKKVSTKESVSDAYQGQLVQVEGDIVSMPDDSTFILNDGSGNVTVFVDGYIVNQSGVPVPSVHVGDKLQAVGLSGKYSQGDRIRVRDTRELKVTDSQPVTSVTGVALNKTAMSLNVNGTEQLTATVQPTDATDKTVAWTSSNSAVATVTANGLVTAVGAGTATITVTTTDGHFTATAEVAVTAPSTNVSVTGVALDKTALSLNVNGTEQLTATVQPADATDKSVAWTSSNPAVATVTANGLVTAVGAGTATITVTTTDGHFAATAEVTVTAPNTNVSVTGITLEQPAVSVRIFGTVSLTATVQPAEATNKAVVWTSSDESIVKVDANGVVTAIGLGVATITAATVDGNFTATSNVTVFSSSSGSSSHGGSGSSGSGSGSGGSTGGNNSDTHSVAVTAEQLTSSGSGPVNVQVPANATEVKLPSNTAELIGQKPLEIKSDRVTLSVPSELLKQLVSKLTADEQKDSSISLKMVPLNDADAKQIIDKGQNAAHADLKLNGNVYEFQLSIVTASGKTVDLTKFEQPITIQMKVDASLNPKLAAVYYISDNGVLEYIGGSYVDGYLVAQIHHFSKYAVLEVSKLFADVPASHWAAGVIRELAAKQLVSGTSETTFEPERSVTRAEFTMLLARALKLTEKGTLTFNDVKATDWYAEAVSMAVKAGIVQGKSVEAFDPNTSITREEAVAMLMRAYEYKNGKASAPASAPFKDQSRISSWAVESVQSAVSLNLIQGRAAGQFDPQGITTRAESAQLIYNFLNK
ncbi:DUF4350 domain-containing protein [Paenibacillus sp. RC67]|uniref:Ig-like domain-containing protein n=1 Tax=Paenibacillus sp. RC67 TaxID=3039392 RepID=UPI0024AD0EDC|nr:DUF4350 domain-containing protein [Paenibacillus sp. RC67]